MATSDEARKNLRDELQAANVKIISLEEELFASQSMSNELLDKLKFAEDQLEPLQQGVAPLQERINQLLADIEKLKHDTYIAHKNDVLDKHLSSYLNAYPEKEKLRIMFLRETEGVYQFGQRRVYLKCEKAGQIFVRVGGGFISIDEFID